MYSQTRSFVSQRAWHRVMQTKFVTIKQQADKSISELRKSIDAIDKVIKSLINENL